MKVRSVLISGAYGMLIMLVAFVGYRIGILGPEYYWWLSSSSRS